MGKAVFLRPDWLNANLAGVKPQSMNDYGSLESFEDQNRDQWGDIHLVVTIIIN